MLNTKEIKKNNAGLKVDINPYYVRYLYSCKICC
jgi:hypothetical protein